MTNTVGKERKWSETKLAGNLRIFLLEHVGVPLSAVRLNAEDKSGLERGVVFEYELPINFKFEPDLAPTFSAIRTHILGEYIGFKFNSEKDKKDFNNAISSLRL